MGSSVIIVATSYNGKLGEQPTGSWVEEVAAPFYAFKMAGMHVDLATISGGPIPWDPASQQGDFFTEGAKAFCADVSIQEQMKSLPSVEEVAAQTDKYDAIFIPGGHGICFDGPDSAGLKQLVETMFAKDKVVSAVCHGPVGLVSAQQPSGDPIVKGKRVTGFTNSEEVAVGKDKLVPFSLEDKLKELGGLFECGEDWGSHAVRDGQLVTGQNPASSQRVAELVIEALMPHPSPVHGKGENEGFHKRTNPVTHEHHEHRDGMPTGTRSDVSHHPQAHASQWHQPMRQDTHTDSHTRSKGHPDRSYTAN